MQKPTENEQQLYYIQHKWIPKFFYMSTMSFVNTLKSEGGQIFVDLLDSMNKHKDEYRCPYSAKDFQVSVMNSDFGVTVLKINMPEPTISPLCRAVYLAYTAENECMCYTMELTNSGQYRLCGWTDEEHHIAFGLDSPISDEIEIENELAWLWSTQGGQIKSLVQEVCP